MSMCRVAGCPNVVATGATGLCFYHLSPRCSPTPNQQVGIAMPRGPYVRYWLTDKAEQLCERWDREAER